jgi:hypothetical protein
MTWILIGVPFFLDDNVDIASALVLSVDDDTAIASAPVLGVDEDGSEAMGLPVTYRTKEIDPLRVLVVH